MGELFNRALARFVRFSERRFYVVLLLAVAFAASCLWYAKTTLQVRSDFTELLPKDSPGLKAYEHQLGRVGGGASFIFVVESPDRTSNEHFIDDVSGRLDGELKKHKACMAACLADEGCKRACGVNLVQYFENGTKEVQTFYRSHKWLFASKKDLEEADSTLDRQVWLRTGIGENLIDEDVPDAASPVVDAGPKPEVTRSTNRSLTYVEDPWCVSRKMSAPSMAESKNATFLSHMMRSVPGNFIKEAFASSNASITREL